MSKPVTHTPTNFSDADRVRLAKRIGGCWYGPEEWDVCPVHPTQTMSHRWTWPHGASVEDSDAYLEQPCSLCDAEEEASCG